MPAPSDRTRLFSRAALVATVASLAVGLAHDLDEQRFELNDTVLHAGALRRMDRTLAQGENPLDHWWSASTLGYPFFRSYPPLGHLLALGFHRIVPGERTPETSLAWVRFLLLCLLPVSVYGGARRAGFGRWAAAWAAALSPALSSSFGYGLELGSFLWRGQGLLAQLAGVHAGALALGSLVRLARHTGARPEVLERPSRAPIASAALWLAIAVCAQPAIAYFIVLSGILAALALGRPVLQRMGAVAAAIAIAALLCAWYVVPAAVDARDQVVSHTWEPWRWGVGISRALEALFTGRLLDHGRWPVATLAAGVGIALAILFGRRHERAALAALGTALLLFAGRETFGRLMDILPMSHGLHFHRAIAVLHLVLAWLAGSGLAALTRPLVLYDGPRASQALAVLVAGLVLVPVSVERSAFLREDRALAAASQRAIERERGDLQRVLARVREILREQPGRAYAGLAFNWGRSFRVGVVPVYALLMREGIDNVGYLWHAMSLASDAMKSFDDWERADYEVFAVSVALLPGSRRAPPFLEPDLRAGRFAVYRVPHAAPLRIAAVDVGWEGPVEGFRDFALARRRAGWERAGQPAVLDPGRSAPGVRSWLRPGDRVGPAPPRTAPPGRVLALRTAGGRYEAEVELDGSAWVIASSSYHRNWRATVDGKPARIWALTPGLVGVPMAPGRHAVVLVYRGEWWSLVLLLVALCAAPILVAAERALRRRRC
jgi:hypothetical protein